ncbi:efflux transporter outer membrane subunit [Methylobacillus arboreus]|uniref:TolC family protein n=1 Tax=Methylobacillus arboreus TaxID=755170 RepID=UPI001E452B56|nr:efflux transporter outer membrane subunit [Methylobacillus arboreus]MCB5191326.1 efflux transporter outer membrane subunit [Methylobacillus arboreus]
MQMVAVACMAMTVQACSIPTVATRKPEVSLPENYANAVHKQSSVASVNWKEFFDDPYLPGLIDTAIANNQEVNMLMQRISMAENEILARKGEYLPFVGVGGAADVEKVGRYTRNGAVEESLEIKEGKSFPKYLGNYQFGLYSSWELDVWKKLRNATKVATMEYMASVEGRNFLVTNLVAEVANAYYELVALDNELETLDSNIQIQQHAFEVVKELQQYARATSLAVSRFEAEVNKNQSQRYVLKQQIVETENRINLLLGRTPQPIQRASGGFMDIRPKIIEAGIPSELLENRPDIRKAQLELAAADLNIEVAKASFYPSFSIKAGVGFQAFNPRYLLRTPESLALSLGGDFMAPLINRNAIIADYKNANAAQVEAAYEYEKTIIGAYGEVANQLSGIDNLEKNYQLKSNQVEALNHSIDVSNQLFKSARADYMEVLLTQRDALEAKMDLIETKQKQVAAVVNLYKALGGGWR